MFKFFELIRAYLPTDREEACLKNTRGVFDLERRMHISEKHAYDVVLLGFVFEMEGH
jgi:hypothetical protein